MSFFYDGTASRRITVPNSADLRFGTGDFTIEFWMFLRSLSPSGFPRMFAFGGYPTSQLVLLYDADGMKLFSGEAVWILFPPTANFFNEWHHIAITRSGTTLRAFKDGVLTVTVPSFTLNFTDSSNNLTIGNQIDANDAISGYITNFRWVTGTAVYTSNFTPSTSPLLPVTGTALLLRAESSDSFLLDNAPTRKILTNSGVLARPNTPFANVSNSMVFAGTTSSSLSIPNSIDLRFRTGDFTIEFFTYHTPQGLYEHVFGMGTDDNRTIGVEYQSESNGAFFCVSPMVFQNWNNAGGLANISNRWTHMAICRSGTTCRLFVDGVQTASFTNTTDYNDSSNALFIGNLSSTAVSPASAVAYKGSLQNFRIVKGTALYTSNFTVPATPLTAVPGTVVLLRQGFVDESPIPKSVTMSSVTYIKDDYINPYVPLPAPLTTDLVPWVWYDADDRTTVTTTVSSGITLLSGWQNKGTSGGAGYGTVTGNIVQQPRLINGRNTLAYQTGSGQFNTGTITATSQAYAIFAVVTFPTDWFATGSNAILQLIGSVGLNVSAYISYYGFNEFYIISGYSGVANQIGATIPATNFFGRTVLVAIVGSPTAANNTVTLDGAVRTLVTSDPASGTPGSGNFAIGSPTGSDFAGSVLSEILVYQGEVSATVRQKVEGYLAWKWGLQTNLPTSHPYHPLYKDQTVRALIRPRSVVTTVGSYGSRGVAHDSKGNIYVHETSTGNIYRITPEGQSSVYTTVAQVSRITVAKNILYVTEDANSRIVKIPINPDSATPGTPTYFTSLTNPDFISADSNENMYVVQGSNVTKITPGDVRTTFISGETTPSLVEHLESGFFYYSVINSHVIKRIPIAGGTATIVAGSSGSSGSTDGIGSDARFSSPFGMDLGADGNFYVFDNGNNKIRRITPTGVVTTVVGPAPGSSASGTSDGSDLNARFATDFGLTATPDGSIYVVEDSTAKLRKISLGAMHDVRTYVGGLTSTPHSVRFDANGNLYVCTFDSPLRLYRVTSQGVTSTVYSAAGSGIGITFDTWGNIYFSDAANKVIRKVSIAGTGPTVIAGSGADAITDGQGTSAAFTTGIRGLVTDSRNNIYVSESQYVRRISPTFYVFTMTSGVLSNVCCDASIGPDDVQYIPDFAARKIYKMTPSGILTVYAGSGVDAITDGVGTAAAFRSPVGSAMDSNGNLYISDNNPAFLIRRIGTDNNVTTIAGTANTSGSNDGVGTAATFQDMRGLAIDPYGSLYVVQIYSNNIRTISISRTPNSNAVTLTSNGNTLSGTINTTTLDYDGLANVGYQYSWQYAALSNGPYSNIPGATSFRYSVPTAGPSGFYRMGVAYRDNRNNAELVYSAPLQFTAPISVPRTYTIGSYANVTGYSVVLCFKSLQATPSNCARIFDFNQNTSAFWMGSPSCDSGGNFRFASYAGATQRNTFTSVAPTQNLQYIISLYNSNSSALIGHVYSSDGTITTYLTSTIMYQPASILPSMSNLWLGRSVYVAEPYFAASYQKVALYDGYLAAQSNATTLIQSLLSSSPVNSSSNLSNYTFNTVSPFLPVTVTAYNSPALTSTEVTLTAASSQYLEIESFQDPFTNNAPGSISISGNYYVAQTLTAIVSNAGFPYSAEAFTYVWSSSPFYNGPYTNIPDATARTYVVKNADVDKFIRLTATLALPNGQQYVFTATSDIAVVTNSFHIVSSTSSSISVGWAPLTKLNGSVSYYSVATTPTTTTTIVSASAATNVTVTGLQATTNYTFTISVVTTRGTFIIGTTAKTPVPQLQNYLFTLNTNSVSPQVWFDAADIHTVSTSGATMTSWANKGSVGGQGTVTFSPIAYGTTSRNGLNIASFTTTSSRITFPSFTTSGAQTGLFYVQKITQDWLTLADGIYGAWLRPSAQFTPEVYGYVSSTTYKLTAGVNALDFYVEGYIPNPFNVYTMTSIGMGTTASSRYISINGAKVPLLKSVSPGGGGVTGSFGIGDYGTHQTDLGELIFYNANVSDTNRQHTEGYLAWKWGFQDDLPASHLYSRQNVEATYMTMVRKRLSVTTPVATGLNSGGYAVKCDNNNNIYIADNGNYAISRTTDAGVLRPFINMDMRYGVRLDADSNYLYIADIGEHRVVSAPLINYDTETPLRFPNLQLWLDGNDPFSNGAHPVDLSTVGAWNDKSGNARHAVARSAARYSRDAPGSLYFGTSNYYYFPSLPSGFDFLAGSNFTVFVVERTTNTNAGLTDNQDNMFLSVEGVVAATNSYPLFGYNTNTTKIVMSYWNNDLAPNSTTEFRTAEINTTRVWSFVQGDSFRGIYLNGTLVGSDANNTKLVAWPSTIIGGNGAGTYTGFLKEFVVYNGTVPTATRQSVENYLIQKWIRPIQYSTSVPQSVSGLVAWFDGDDPAGTGVKPANGAAVTMWVDKSGNGRNATAQVAAPYVAATSSSPGYLNFTGSNYYTMASLTGIMTNVDITIFIVERAQVNGTWILGNLVFEGNNASLHIRNNITSFWFNYFNNDLTPSTGLTWTDATTNKTRVWTLTQRTNLREIYLNGNRIGFDTNNTKLSAFGYPALGAIFDNHFYTGYLQEVLFYSGTMATSDRLKIEKYLTAKWWPTNPYITELPKSIGGLQVWFDGADPAGTGTPPRNGASVGTWVDRSGNNRNATAVNAATYVSGNPGALSFNGTNTAYTFPNASSWFANQYFTIFVVERQMVAGRAHLLGDNGQDPGNSLHIRYDTASSSNMLLGYYFNDLNQTTGIEANVGSNAQPTRVWTFSQQSNSRVIYQNGVSFASDTNNTRLGGWSDPVIGTALTNDSYFNGYIKEILIYTGIMATADRQSIEDYLRYKWHPQFNPIAQVKNPYGIAVDPVIRRVYVNSSADSNTYYFSSIGGSTITQISGGTLNSRAQALRLDASRSTLYAATDTRYIQAINLNTGTVSNVVVGGSGDLDAAGSDPSFNNVADLEIDRYNNLYFPDLANNKIRMVTPAGLTTILAGPPAGTTTSGTTTNCLDWNARFSNVLGLGLSPNGVFYATDTGNSALRRLAPMRDSQVLTFAGPLPGTTTSGTTTNVPASDARFTFIEGCAYDPNGNAYVCDVIPSLFRKISPTGYVTTPVSGMLTNRGAVSDKYGNIYVVVQDSNAVFKVSPAGATNRFISGLNVPRGAITIDTYGNVYVNDTNNKVVKRATPSGTVTTFLSFPSFNNDELWGLRADYQNNLYVVNATTQAIYKYSPSGTLLQLLSNGTGYTQGPLSVAKLNGPIDFLVNANNDIYTGTSQMFKLQNNVATYYAGSDSAFGDTDGIGLQAQLGFNRRYGITPLNDIVYADTGNNKARLISTRTQVPIYITSLPVVNRGVSVDLYNFSSISTISWGFIPNSSSMDYMSSFTYANTSTFVPVSTMTNRTLKVYVEGTTTTGVDAFGVATIGPVFPGDTPFNVTMARGKATCTWTNNGGYTGQLQGYTVAVTPDNISVNIPANQTSTTLSGIQVDKYTTFTLYANTNFGTYLIASRSNFANPFPYEPVLWLDATEQSTITTTWSTVTRWQDKSIMNNSAVANYATGPVLSSISAATGIFYSTIYFPGTTQQLVSQFDNMTTGSASRAVFAICVNPDAGGTGLINTGPTNQIGRMFGFHFQNVNNIQYVPTTWDWDLTFATTITNLNCYYGGVNGANLNIEGAIGFSNPSIRINDLNTVPARWEFGYRSGDGATVNRWHLSEFVHFNTYLNATDRQYVNAYLAFKYNISSLMSPTHLFSTGVTYFPGLVSNVSATAGPRQAVVHFSTATFNGGEPITNYVVRTYPGGNATTTATSPVTISNLEPFQPVYFGIAASNAVGAGGEVYCCSTVTPDDDSSRYNYIQNRQGVMLEIRGGVSLSMV